MNLSRNSEHHPLSPLPGSREDTTIILGGGLSGLSAGHVLVKAGWPVTVFESDPEVGGLSKTVVKRGFRFDLGGHRFITKSRKIELFVKELLGGEFLTVSRKSKIFMRKKFFDYPLRPSNVLFGLGIPTTFKIIFDYSIERIKNLFVSPINVSLEDWVVNNFGRTMFNLYFKEYSEKVWGIGCESISKEWVEQRIKGLSLWAAIKNAFFKFSGKHIDTLADKFIYPINGIGQISVRLKEEIDERNAVLTDTRVIQINHEDFSVRDVNVMNNNRLYSAKGEAFISSIPLTALIQMLHPAAPDDIVEAAAHLKYRDIVIVTVMLNREKVTDLTWMYLPEKNIQLGRIHEPRNWSPSMAPEGKTSVVSEYFCFKDDRVWNSSDEELTAITVKQLEELGFINGSEIIDSCVIRLPNAYPLFEIGYSEHYNKILEYLKNFKNLNIIGRGGMFRYYNMDHAMESGIELAENILRKPQSKKEKDTLLIKT